MLTFKRPILAASLLPPSVEHTDENILAAMQKLRYPVLATLKKDGIRALRLNGSLLSRTLKPIPNKSIRERSLVMPGGFDMELWNPGLDYCEIESIVMSREHERSDEIQFHVLDWVYVVNPGFVYEERVRLIRAMPQELADIGVRFGLPVQCNSAEELFSHFKWSESVEGEGICFRLPNSPYKQGRSTLKEQYLVKLSRYSTAEAVIQGFVEQQANTNRAKWNAVGAMDRSSYVDGMVGKDTLGALIVRDKERQHKFSIGTGFDDKMRKWIWHNMDKCLGRTITYKYKAHGEKVLPRSPVFKGFRDKIDI